MDEARVREICREEIAKADRLLSGALGAGIAAGAEEAANAIEMLMLGSGRGEQAAVFGELLRLARDKEREIRSQLGLEIPDDISQLGDDDPDGEPTR